MNLSKLFILIIFIMIKNIASETQNVTVTSYDPAEVLSKIFNPNVTIEPRQRGYGFIRFEDQTDPGIDPDGQDAGQYGLIDFERDQRPLRFEDDNDNQNYGANLDAPTEDYANRPLKFEDSNQDLASNNGQVNFQDDNRVDDQGNKNKRRRRRRRKPKNGVLPYYPRAELGGAGKPGFQGPVQGGYGLNQYANPGYAGQPYRRPRRPRPRPSIASEALSTITEALTSIARYDDYQCVPRLLCEAAGGGSLGDNGVLQSIAGIQPLLTLLSAYNGISSSPLFVFGRAVFLGMTSKGNTGTCRYAYPQCPTDPEQLIYYLNNHNGGFFRFFNAPQLPNQNLQQFYNQLGQGGFNQPDQQNYGTPGNNPGNYPVDPNSGQGYGYYPNNPGYAPGLNEDQNYNQNYVGQRPNGRPSLYGGQNYGSNYAYDYNNYGRGNRIRFKDNARIEKRIQNNPTQSYIDDNFDDANTKWQFPDDTTENINYNIRDSRTLKFPDESQSQNIQKDYNRKGKQIYFPGNQNYYNKRQQNANNRYQTTTYSYNSDQNNQNYYNNRQPFYTNNYNRYQTSTYSYNNGQNQNYYDNNNRPNFYTNNYNNDSPPTYYNYNQTPSNNAYQNSQNYYNNQQNSYNNNNKHPTTVFNNEEYVFDYKHNFYVKKVNKVNNFKRYEENGLKTVYVVRGNGDPNRPEIVKLRPGQSVH